MPYPCKCNLIFLKSSFDLCFLINASKNKPIKISHDNIR